MKRWTLKNGMTVLYQEKDMASAAVEVLVNVGSDWERVQQRGIAHFIEHMVFEGTTTRADAKVISNEIEKVGGISNAYTTNGRTCYHAKVPRKHIDIALDVTADILMNPLLRESDTKRQKHILFKEIDMVTDEPRFHQWVLFQKALFLKHPSRYPTYGTRKAVEAVTRQDLVDFYKKYYFPGNMIACVVGQVDNVKKKMEGLFGGGQKRGLLRKKRVIEPVQKNNRIKKEKRKQASTYFVLGHRTVPRLHPDSYVIDVIDGILGRGQSGWMFDEIRNKAGLAYEVGTERAIERDFGFFATFLGVDKKNIVKVKPLILQQLKKLENVSADDVADSKTFVEGSYALALDDTQRLADEMVYWEQVGDARLIDQYVKKIRAITVKDVQLVAKKYFRKPHVVAMIEGK
jgi:predicted Zn-dependent peptidase